MILFFGMLLACQPSMTEENEARKRYNDASTELSLAKWEDAGTIFLEARDQAGQDQELRQDSAYNLGFSLAQQAIFLEESEPERASELYEQSIAWFQDAIRLDESARDARINLEVVLAKKRLLVDKLTQGDNSLENRLAVLTSDLRSIREQCRKLYSLIEDVGGSADSARFRADLEAMAVKVRELQADASLIMGLADDEQTNITNVPEEQREQEQQIRLMQLVGFSQYLGLARTDIAQTRRNLRALDLELSLKRLDDSLYDLKRTAEQLMSPIDVLGNIVRDQDSLRQQTDIMVKVSSSALSSEQEIRLPTWLNGTWLSEQQFGIEQRTDDVRKILAYQLDNPIEEPTEEQTYVLESISEALPPLEEAISGMKKVEMSLNLGQEEPALREEIEVLRKLMEAVETFSELKQLIERAYRDHVELMSLLDAEEGDLETVWARNLKRINGLKTPLQMEKKKRLMVLSSEENTEKSAEQKATELEEVEQFFTYADTQRTEAITGLGDMKAATLSLEEVRERGTEVQSNIEELRMMFFTLIEHLKDIAARQETLLDQTTESSIKEYEDQLLDLQLIGPNEAKLQARLEQATEALSAQADAMAEQDPEKSEQFGQAAVETGLATQFLDDILSGIGIMLQDQTSSHDVAEILGDQRLGLEAVIRAIQILEPPEDQDGDEEQEEEDSDVSEEQAQKKMQKAKEREAERAKEQRQMAQEPVEKDW